LCSYDEVPRVFLSLLLLLRFKNFLLSMKSTIIEKPINEWHKMEKTDATQFLTIQSLEVLLLRAK